MGAYAGYERMYNGVNMVKGGQQMPGDAESSPHSNPRFTESLLTGLTKSYKINTKYNGEIELLYDVWWQQKGLPSPFVLRFATIKK